MSTVISGGYPMAEKLHKDFQSNNFYGRDIGDTSSFSLHSMPLGTNEKFPPRSNASLVGVWQMQRPTNVTRRNSTSSVSSISSARNRLNMNSLTSMANVIPETTTAAITAASISSMPTMEERYRGRAYSEGASSLSMENNLPQQQPGALSRYKTELCRPFEENGKCKYGDKCQFAHGKQELRHLIRHPKYKTELCRTFHTSGFCPYGPRCHFIHNQDDSANRANIALQAAANHQQPHGAPMAVPTPHISQRNHHGRRPAHLSLPTTQLSTGTTIGNLPFQSTQTSLGGSPPYYQQDLGSSALMSPTSPSSVNNGTMFNFSNPAAALASYMMNAQYDSTFEMLLSQGPQYETTVNDDSAFEGSMTPPDSDPESMTGSPPEKQRLPIFRCLSQTS